MLEPNLFLIYNNDFPEYMGCKLAIYSDGTINYPCRNSKSCLGSLKLGTKINVFLTGSINDPKRIRCVL